MAHTVRFEFTPKDTVFFLHENRVLEGKVKHIQTNQDDNGVRVKYNIEYSDRKRKHHHLVIPRASEFVFGTKQELLESL